MNLLRPIAFLGILFASPALAATCQVNPQGVAFGGYDTLASAPLDGAGTITVDCDVVTAFTVTLGTGSGSYQTRRMINGAGQLDYNLYTDPTRLFVWGDGVTSAAVTIVGVRADLPVYGRIPARQNVPASGYADSVTVTVSY